MSPSSPSRSSVWSVTSAAAAEALSKNCTSSSFQSYLQGKEMEGLEPLPSTKRSASTHARAGRQAGIRNQQEYYSPLAIQFRRLNPEGRSVVRTEWDGMHASVRAFCLLRQALQRRPQSSPNSPLLAKITHATLLLALFASPFTLSSELMSFVRRGYDYRIE